MPGVGVHPHPVPVLMAMEDDLEVTFEGALEDRILGGNEPVPGVVDQGDTEGRPALFQRGQRLLLLIMAADPQGRLVRLPAITGSG